MSTETTHPPLTSEEQDDFEAVLGVLAASALNELPDGVRVALVRVSLDDQPQSVIAIVDERGTETDEAEVRPLAVLVNDALFERLVQPLAPRRSRRTGSTWLG